MHLCARADAKILRKALLLAEMLGKVTEYSNIVNEELM
jgi:hypothetical protein